MRALVVGCAGFIGFHLADRLLREGHDVVGMDNFVTGQRRNVDDLKAHRQFTFVEHDIVRPLSPIEGVERVYNLACPPSPVDFKTKSLEILATCSQGVWNLADFARDSNATITHSSTSEVYGDPIEHPQRETYWGNVNPIGPRSAYDEGKRFGEALLIAHHRRFGTEVRVARIFNTYGPRMRHNDGRALPTFIDQALRNEPVTIHGDGKQTRSFCFVTDLVDGLIRLSQSDSPEPVNLGNPVEITILEVAQEVIKAAGSKSGITHTPADVDDPRVRRPDISRAQERLGWAPKVSREDGVARTVAWFAEEKQALTR
ncbi:MAG: SDR family oxidoreductase [Phycisphaerales bacterium]|nr:SDR family oxidoreductase [Phycisphaerales bacterium]